MSALEADMVRAMSLRGISRGALGWFIGFFAPYEVMVALNMAAGVDFPACLLRLF